MRRWLGWLVAPPPQSPREAARARAIGRGLIAAMLFVLVASLAQLPLLILSPGPTYNTIGEVDGRAIIEISGTTTYPAEGALDMTTVLERGGNSGGVHLGEALVGWVSPRGTVVPRDTFYSPEVTSEEISEQNDQLFALSKSDAIAAAMGELGIPTQESVVVTFVGGGTPSDGIVQAGDEVLRVDGKPVDDPEDVGRAVRAREVGDTVVLDVRRVDESGVARRERLEVQAGAIPNASPGDPAAAEVPYLGIQVGTAYEAPFEIDVTLEDVGGPSAGLMLSLAIVDLLTEGSMTAGGHVAGTGSIEPDGDVGPIGGIAQKLKGARDAGATLFLAPEANCDEVLGNEPRGLAVVPVGTLEQARDVLRRWVDDKDAPLPSCGTGPAAHGGA